MRSLIHEPETPCRPSIYGEGIFVGQWKHELAKVPDHGTGETEEMFCKIFGDLDPIDQRDATVAASFICWLGTNAGNSYLHESALRRHSEGGDEAYLLQWALWNRRVSYINGGKRTVEAILREPTIRDLEVIEKLAEWLGTPPGRVFLKNANDEIEATRKAIIARTQMENRARLRANEIPGIP